ncbi:MAG TPA: hypothetical protein VIU62_13130, partial [Chloroflexota bacterium]
MGVQYLSRRTCLRAACGAVTVLGASMLVACGQTAGNSASTSAVLTTSQTASSARLTSSATSSAASATVAGTARGTATTTTSTPAAATTVTAAATTLEFMRPSGSPAEDQAYIAMLSGWSAAYPGTKATFVSAPNANYQAKLLTEIAGG